jgi:recombination protein RecT
MADNTAIAPTTANLVKGYLRREDVKAKLDELLGKRANGFVASVIQLVANDKLLSKADYQSIINSAMIAAALNLPIEPSLGFAWIVPYAGKGQFQIGWKGFVQLAQRSSRYHKINVVEVYENQFKSYNRLTEDFEADMTIDGDGKIVGYCGYFLLDNGFSKLVYWSVKEVTAHAKKYSQAFRSDKAQTPWKDETGFIGMAKKTVVKLMLAKWGPLSVEMEMAVKFDQGVVEDLEHEVVTYPDNELPELNHEHERVKSLIESEFENIEHFEAMIASISPELVTMFQNEIDQKREEIKARK